MSGETPKPTEPYVPGVAPGEFAPGPDAVSDNVKVCERGSAVPYDAPACTSTAPGPRAAATNASVKAVLAQGTLEG